MPLLALTESSPEQHSIPPAEDPIRYRRAFPGDTRAQTAHEGAPVDPANSRRQSMHIVRHLDQLDTRDRPSRTQRVTGIAPMLMARQSTSHRFPAVGGWLSLRLGAWAYLGVSRPSSMAVVERGPTPVAAGTTEEVRAKREAKLDVLHERLTVAVGRLVTGEDWLRAVAFAARFRSRSFGNTLLIHVQHQDAFERGRVLEPFPSLVAGFQQWKQLGRSVLKGQSGYMIFAPESWRRLERGEKPRAGEVVRSKMVGVKPAYVWDVSQTDGEPVPERPRPVLLEGESPEGLWEGLSELVADHGFTLGVAENARALGRCQWRHRLHGSDGDGAGGHGCGGAGEDVGARAGPHHLGA